MLLWGLLFLNGIMLAMDKPPLAIISADQRDTWHLSEDEVEQIGSLRDQKNYGPGTSCLFLSSATSPENFTNLLLFVMAKSDSLEKIKNKKAALKAKTTAELAQLAMDADCLGAERLLDQTLRILQKRVSVEDVPPLPETLQQQLGQMVGNKNPCIKTLLLKAYSARSPVPNITQIKAPGMRNGSLIINHEEYSEKIDLNGNSFVADKTQIIRGSNTNKFLVTNSEHLFFIDGAQRKVLQKWSLPIDGPDYLVVHDQGAIVTLFDHTDLGLAHTNRRIFFYEMGVDGPKLFAPFRTCPTAMALNANNTKVVAGSAEGEIGVFDIKHPKVNPLILGSITNALVNFNVVRIAEIDPAEKYVAVCMLGSAYPDHRKECELGIWSLKEKKYHQLEKRSETQNVTNCIDDIKFNQAGDLLLVLKYGNLQIWHVKDKTMLHNVRVPESRQSTLTIHTDDLGCTMCGDYDEWFMKLPLIDGQVYKQVKCLPLPVIAFLARAGKKIQEGKQIGFADEKNLKLLYRASPPSLQKIIAAHVSLKDWIWL